MAIDGVIDPSPHAPSKRTLIPQPFAAPAHKAAKPQAGYLPIFRAHVRPKRPRTQSGVIPFGSPQKSQRPEIVEGEAFLEIVVARFTDTVFLRSKVVSDPLCHAKTQRSRLHSFQLL